jgi:hypothetical protein
MTRKKIKTEDKNEETFFDFGFGLIDPKNSDFTTLAKGIGLDPNDLMNFLNKNNPNTD